MIMMVSSNRVISYPVGMQCVLHKAAISYSVALIGAAIIDPPLSDGAVRECYNERVAVRLSYNSSVTKASNRSCFILYQTADNTAIGNGSTLILVYH